MYDELAKRNCNIPCETKDNILSNEIEKYVKGLNNEKVTEIYEEAKQIKEIIFKYYMNSYTWRVNNGKEKKHE